MKKAAIIFTIIFLSFAVISCEKDDPVPVDPNVSFMATLNGASEVPANASAATGMAMATFNSNTKILSVTTTYSGITVTNAHIHKAVVGVSGAVVFPFTSPFTSPIYTVTAALDATQEADLYAHLYYVNLHTAAYPGGEIRGQLIKQ